MRLLKIVIYGVVLFPAVPGSARADDRDELVGQLTRATKHAELADLVNRLEEFALEKVHVQRLIDAAEVDSSDARKMYLWQAIRLSRSRLGRQYLEKALLEDADAAARLKFVGSVTWVDVEDVPLLSHLYSKAKDGGVRRAILDLATRSSRDFLRSRQRVPREKIMEMMNRAQSALDLLAERIVEDPANDDDLNMILSAVNGRAGVNRLGRKLLREAWARAKTEERKIRLLKIAAEDAKDMLGAGLQPDEPEAVKLAALKGLKQMMEEESSDYRLRRLLPTLLEIRKSSPALQEEIAPLLGSFRRTEVEKLSAEIEKLPRDLEQLKRRINDPPKGKELEALRLYVAQVEGMVPRYRRKFERSLGEIEAKFGKLQGEERASLEDSIKRATERAEELLREIKKAISKPR